MQVKIESISNFTVYMCYPLAERERERESERERERERGWLGMAMLYDIDYAIL